MDEHARVVLVGIGGIGGCLLPQLARLMAYSKGLPKRLVLVDGDNFESGNAERQQFSQCDLLQNKAESWAARIARDFPMLELSAKSEYLKPGNARSFVLDGDVVILCVDNHASRLAVQERASQLPTIWLVSGGNDYSDGNIQIFAKRNGRVLAPPLAQFHPEIAQPRDKRPDELGCDEEVKSSPQLLTANFMAASLMLNAVYALSSGLIGYHEVYFDTVQNIARPIRRIKQK